MLFVWGCQGGVVSLSLEARLSARMVLFQAQESASTTWGISALSAEVYIVWSRAEGDAVPP